MTDEELREARKLLASQAGIARQAQMTSEQRTEHARHMLRARWDKHKSNPTKPESGNGNIAQ